MIRTLSTKQLKLFQDVGNAMKYSLNVYSNSLSEEFDAIFNLFDPRTIDDCYDESLKDEAVEGIKDSFGNWSTKGHPDRVVNINQSVILLLQIHLKSAFSCIESLRRRHYVS